MKIKISEHKAFNIELIQMGKKGKVLLSIRQLYNTKKDKEWKPGRQGMTFAIESEDNNPAEARRVVKAMIKVLKNEDGKKPKLIEKDD